MNTKFCKSNFRLERTYIGLHDLSKFQLVAFCYRVAQHGIGNLKKHSNIVKHVLIMRNNWFFANYYSSSVWNSSSLSSVVVCASIEFWRQRVCLSFSLEKMSSHVEALHQDELEAIVAVLIREWPETSSRKVQRRSLCSFLVTPRDLTPWRPRPLPSDFVFHHPPSHPRLAQDHRNN